VETGGRWSKPHVSTPSLHSLFDLRSAIQRGTCVLELDLDVGTHDVTSSTSGIAAAAERRTASLEHVAGKQSIPTRPHACMHFESVVQLSVNQSITKQCSLHWLLDFGSTAALNAKQISLNSIEKKNLV